MAKFKIQKNLSDQDMFKGFSEEETFETAMLKDEVTSGPKGIKKKVQGTSKDEFYREFLTETIETEIGKALLDIKMEYFKDGVGDFFVQVKKEGKRIILETGPKKVKN